LLLLTHYLSLFFFRAWEKIIDENKGQYNPIITFWGIGVSTPTLAANGDFTLIFSLCDFVSVFPN
jgi:hypothetical protein